MVRSTLCFFPDLPHFPMSRVSLSAFASLFQNVGTLSQYLGHVGKAEVLLKTGRGVDPVFRSMVVRGIARVSTMRPRTRYMKDDVKRLMSLALREGDPGAARFYAVAYSWLFRVESELTPLQTDGRCGRVENSVGWHSAVVLGSKKCKIHLRKRKNALNGATLELTCICVQAPCPLCPVCFIRAQLKSRGRNADASSLVFPENISRHADLKRRATQLGLEVAGWHAFRRGAPEDLVRSGYPIGFILKAGGWRSGAFLRYTSAEALDTRAVTEAFLSNSDSD